MQKLDFEWVRGDDEYETLVFESDTQEIDFTGCKFDLHIVPERGGRIRLSSDDGITAEGNKVSIVVEHSLTEAVAWTSAVWDLQMTDKSGRVKTLVGGRLKLVADVTGWLT